MVKYDIRLYSVRDFYEWRERGELELQPKFQRRLVWSEKARSYLMDSIVRGKPIPKIYLRQLVNPRTKRTVREVVDGQQRLQTVLTFLKDGFRISHLHNEEHGGEYYSELDEETQKEILAYEFAVGLLHDATDAEVYDVFARLNTYSVRLNHQELRNALFYGAFKVAAYQLATEFMTFWQANKVFTDARLARMDEAEFTSELLIAMIDGIKPKSKGIIDGYYAKYDDELPGRSVLLRKFRNTMDVIGGFMGDLLAQSNFRHRALLYSLFCSIYHMSYGLPGIECERAALTVQEYPKVRVALEEIDRLVDAREEDLDILPLDQRRFREAYKVHAVHFEERKYRTEYICSALVRVLGP